MSSSATATVDVADMAAVLRDYVPRADYEGALEALNAAIGERDEHRTAAEKHTGRVTELEKKLRGKAAREAFERAADKLKIDPKFRDDAFRLAEVPADADEPDMGAVEQHVSRFLKDRPHLIQQEPAKPKTIPAGEGSERGRSTAPGEPELRVTRQQMGDAVFMRANQGRVAAAAKAGLLTVDD
jgi:hypothetical protein